MPQYIITGCAPIIRTTVLELAYLGDEHTVLQVQRLYLLHALGLVISVAACCSYLLLPLQLLLLLTRWGEAY